MPTVFNVVPPGGTLGILGGGLLGRMTALAARAHGFLTRVLESVSRSAGPMYHTGLPLGATDLLETAVTIVIGRRHRLTTALALERCV